MNSTGFNQDPHWKNLPVANGYLNGQYQDSPANWPGPYWGVMGNGGVMSTTRDLYSWWLALQKHTILSKSSTDRLFLSYVNQDEKGVYYGYGWTIEDAPYGQLITHNGGGIGGSSDVAVYPNQGLVIIILTNQITYRTFFNIPYDVNIVATEVSRQLFRNMMSEDYSKMPGVTFSIWPYILGSFSGLTVIILGIVLLRRRRTG